MFGQSTGPPPDRFLVGLATLTLFAEVAEDQPLVCVVDDAQWLDDASAQIVGFVARRLLAERIALVCAARSGVGDEVFAGLPELPVAGSATATRGRCSWEACTGPLDAAVCEQVITESHGNPLALLELPRTWNIADLAGGFGLPASQPIVGRIEQSYAKRLQVLPADTRLLVLAAAAEPLGDPVLLHDTAQCSGWTLPRRARRLTPACSRWARASTSPTRSSARRRIGLARRRTVSACTARSPRPPTPRGIRIGALASCAGDAGPDEEVAAELEGSADRAQARGGVAAAAAFLERAAALSPDPAKRARRTLEAAEGQAACRRAGGRVDAARSGGRRAARRRESGVGAAPEGTDRAGSAARR